MSCDRKIVLGFNNACVKTKNLMGLPILIPYAPPEGGTPILWVPVHIEDVKKYGIDVKAVKKVGIHGRSLKVLKMAHQAK